MPINDSTMRFHDDIKKGRKRVFEQHTDHNGDVHEHRYDCPIGHDIDQALLDWVPKLEATLIESDKQQYQTAIQNGGDPSTLVTKHLTVNQKAQRVVKALMLGNPEKILKAAEFIQGFTNTQIDNFFNQAQRIRIRTRQNYILNNQAIFNADVREEI